MGKIGLIFNLRAGRSRRGEKCLNFMQSALKGEGKLVVTENLSEIPQAISRLREIDPEIFGVYGGDGTFLHTLTAYLKEKGEDPWPKFLILRGGTMNAVLSHFESHVDPRRVLQSLLEKRRRGEEPETVPVNLLEVNGSYGFTAGTIMPANLVAAYHKGPGSGAGKAIWVTARLIASALAGGEFSRRLLSPQPARLWVEGKESEMKVFTFIMASTINYVGLGFRPMYQAGKRPGCFHLLATDESARKMVTLLGKARRAEPMPELRAVDIQATSARVAFRRPLPVMMDGEFFRDRTVEIQTGPRVDLIVR